MKVSIIIIISLITSRSCSDYEPIKERNYDDFYQSSLVTMYHLNSISTGQFFTNFALGGGA